MAGWLWRDHKEVLLEVEKTLLDSQRGVGWRNAAADTSNTKNPIAAAEEASGGLEPPSPTEVAATMYSINDTPVNVGGEAHSIHTIKATSSHAPKADPGSSTPIVLWHGYGQGGASWWRNMPFLANQHRSGTVLATDWLGCGGSSRPSWTAGQDGEAAEDWFVDSLEQWRVQQGLQTMHVVGHSMGAIIAVRYAERYPKHVSSLVLASPAGVPHPPAESFRERIEREPFSIRRELFRTIGGAWESGYTPQFAARLAGGWLGRKMIQGYVNRRFHESVTDKTEFAEYMYQHWQGSASGELALQAMLMPGAFAKRPLIDRIPHLDPEIPITFIYGDRDWMDIRPAQVLQKRLAAATGSGGGNNKTGPERVVRCFELEEAGHQLMIDQPALFNDVVLKSIHDDEVARGAAPFEFEFSSADAEAALARMEAAGSTQRQRRQQPGPQGPARAEERGGAGAAPEGA